MIARLGLGCILLLAAGNPAPPSLFTFHTGFWLNLHHFLYVLGRAANNTPDSRRRAVTGAAAEEKRADLPAAQRTAWEAALSEYQSGPSREDLVFDRGLAETTHRLAEAGDDPAPPPLPDRRLQKALEEAGPVYLKVWWEGHRLADQARRDELEKLLAQYGRPIADFLSRTWQQHWPAAGFTVEVSAYANWAGAYSTRGGLIVLSSTDPGNAGSQGLETIFHEAMHQWDRAMAGVIEKAARRLGRPVPPQLSHSLIFYTAGYAVAQAVPGHRPYAEANGLWARGALLPRVQLDQHWLPYLQGRGTLEQAIEGLLSPAAANPHQVK